MAGTGKEQPANSPKKLGVEAGCDAKCDAIPHTPPAEASLDVMALAQRLASLPPEVRSAIQSLFGQPPQ